MTEMPPGEPAQEPVDPEYARGASELDEIVAGAEHEGFTAEFAVPDDDADEPLDGLRCPQCGRTSSAGEFVRAWSRRLEGASDPADMMHVSALSCPSCSTRGIFISPFGASMSERQTAVLQALRTT